MTPDPKPPLESEGKMKRGYEPAPSNTMKTEPNQDKIQQLQTQIATLQRDLAKEQASTSSQDRPEPNDQ